MVKRFIVAMVCGLGVGLLAFLVLSAGAMPPSGESRDGGTHALGMMGAVVLSGVAGWLTFMITLLIGVLQKPTRRSPP